MINIWENVLLFAEKVVYLQTNYSKECIIN